MNADLAITLLLSLIDRAATISALIAKAKSEGRDISTIELAALAAADDAAKVRLDAAIKASFSP